MPKKGSFNILIISPNLGLKTFYFMFPINFVVVLGSGAKFLTTLVDAVRYRTTCDQNMGGVRKFSLLMGVMLNRGSVVQNTLDLSSKPPFSSAIIVKPR